MVKALLPTLLATTLLTPFGAAQAQNAVPPDVSQFTIAEGDSLTACADASCSKWMEKYQATRPNVALSNKAVGGSFMSSVQSRKAVVLALKPNFVALAVGANDIGGGTGDMNAYANEIWVYTDELRAAGIKVALTTILPQCNNTNLNTRRVTLNNLIRAAEGVHIDKVIDWAANATIGVDAAACDTNKWNVDGIHPTDSTQVIMASIATAPLDQMIAATTPRTPTFVPALYAAGSTANVEDTSPMPVLQKQVRDIPTVALNWTVPCTNCFVSVSAPAEVKARFQGNATHAAFDDPIRAYGQPGTSHLHMFFGSCSTNAFSTSVTLRLRGNQAAAQSKCASAISGGPTNTTGYWIAGVVKTNPFGDGKNYMVRPYDFSVYYQGDIADVRQRLARGLRFVFGTNMDDPDGLVRQAELTTANAQTGTAGRYACEAAAWPGQTQAECFAMNGNQGWKCVDPSSNDIVLSGGRKYVPALKKADGSDPFEGLCISGHTLVQTIVAPECYDRTNLWVPGGYKHFRQQVVDTVLSKKVCPNGWARVPQLQLSALYRTTGFADYQNWRLASDDAAAALTGHAWLNGSSGHTDWMNGWGELESWGNADNSVLGWMQACLHAGTGQTAPTVVCNTNTINATSRLIGGGSEPAPDGSRNPQVNFDPNQFTTANAAGMQLIPTITKGPITIQAGPK